MWLKHCFVRTFAISCLLSLVSCDDKCKNMRRKATRLSAHCCKLTRPGLDSGLKECRDSLNLPTNRRFNFVEQYAINMCVEECNYLANGYIEIDPPFILDIENTRRNLKSIMPEPKSESVEFMEASIAKCEIFYMHHAGRFALHLPDVDFIETACNPYALHITICVRILAMQKCPTRFYVDSEECAMAKTYFLECVGDIESNLA